MGEISAEMWDEYSSSPTLSLRNQIAEEYMPLAAKVARKFAFSSSSQREDLEQVANIALLKAVEKFDRAMNVAFSTYAVHVMAGEIRHYLRDKTDAIHVNRTDKERLQKLISTQEKLMYELSREPSIKEIAAKMQIPLEEALYLLEMRESTDVLSLDYSTDDNDDDSIGNFAGSTDENFVKVENRQWMEWILSTLTQRERQLVEERFINRKSQRETAKIMSVSQMYVSRMEKRIIDRLRKQSQQSEMY